MALIPDELFSESPGLNQTRTIVYSSEPKVFAAGAGTILRNAPVSFNTVLKQWAPWVQGGADGTGALKGILFPDDLELNAGGEKNAHVLLRGLVHADDVKAATTQLPADVDEILRTEARLLGIDVQGLTEVR